MELELRESWARDATVSTGVCLGGSSSPVPSLSPLTVLPLLFMALPGVRLSIANFHATVVSLHFPPTSILLSCWCQIDN